MTELDLIIDFHKKAERQGPGSGRDTLKALGFMDLPAGSIKVADIGCGSGGQTITLAQNISGQITAVDLFPEFLEELDQKSKKLGLEDKIVTLAKSMDDLPFPTCEFDIIWSEGAIYNIGFENGIKQWKDYLKVGGYLAVSEITWISRSRPKEIEEFWAIEYPEIDRASNKIKILEDNGYTLAGYFYLDEESWVKNYYEPMKARFGTFLERHGHSELSAKVVNDYKAEIDQYFKFKEYFTYGFYIARKDS